jgi:hypothetical protein
MDLVLICCGDGGIGPRTGRGGRRDHSPEERTRT